jgi:Prp8 binding protein
MTDKRKEPPTAPNGAAIVKRQRQSADGTNGTSTAVTIGGGSTPQQRAVVQAVKRTSALRAPIMELSGHMGEVFAVRFDTTGHHIASGSFDRSILLWNTYGDCENYGIIEGHKGAVLDLQWSRDSRTIYSASADYTLATWDAETGERIKKHVGHEDIVNSVAAFRRGGETLASGSDDCTIGVHSPFIFILT